MRGRQCELRDDAPTVARTTASGIVVPMTIACCARRETRFLDRQTSTRRQTRTSTAARRVRRCSNTWATTTTTGLQEGKRATSPKLASGAPRTRRHHHDPPPPFESEWGKSETKRPAKAIKAVGNDATLSVPCLCFEGVEELRCHSRSVEMHRCRVRVRSWALSLYIQTNE